MASVQNQELIDRFEDFYRTYYHNEIGQLAQQYPNDSRSLVIDWGDLYRFDQDLADDIRNQPGQLLQYAKEALRQYDLPADISLGQAHLRVSNLPETTGIRDIRSRHVNSLVEVRGIIRKATGVRPKIQESAFECQRCGTLTRIPQTRGKFREPHQCQGCERQGPFRINFDQSEFIDAQKLRIQESPEGLRGGETPQSIDIHIEDDITGRVTPGDHVRVTGILHLEQQGSDRDKSTMFDVFMEGISIEVEDEQFDEMDITDEDKQAIIELSNLPDIYEQMVDSIAPTIYGHDEAKLAMVLQLFSGVTKHLPDGSRTRGDLHMLLIGDPGTGKCVAYDSLISLSREREAKIGDIVESNLENPTPISDGLYQEVDIPIESIGENGRITRQRITRVWKREAPAKMIRINTMGASRLEVTPSHPLFILEETRVLPICAKNLVVGQYVAVPREKPRDDDIIPISRSTLANIFSDFEFDSKIEKRSNRKNQSLSRGELRKSLRRCEVNLSDHHRIIGNSNSSDPVLRAHQLDGVKQTISTLKLIVESDIGFDRINDIETVTPEYEWVYDLEIHPHHNYIANGILSHNSQLLQYIRHIAPRSVYTSGKGSSAAGLTASAVRDDFGDGQQWSLEAGALVLADKGIAAVDELDKMRCVAGDTSVSMNSGSTVPIGELAKKAACDGDTVIENFSSGRTIRGFELEVQTVNENGSIVNRSVNAIHEYYTIKKFVEVKFSNGSLIRTTENHPFLVVEDGRIVKKEAHRLSLNDTGIVPVSTKKLTDGGTVVIRKTHCHFDKLGPHLTVSSISSVKPVIESTGENVYDLTVEGTHNFIANGIVVHNSEDRSAMHQALEQQEISISKAGINATLKSRCSLLGAANPKYGRFDQYEPIGEQIDLEPALISRFDLIFTMSDQPNSEEDRRLADHILRTNYAGELATQIERMNAPDVNPEEFDSVSKQVTPAIEPDILRKYIAYSQQNCYPRMTEEAMDAIRNFYVDLRSKGADEDAPVPVTARKLEALVRLSEASARIRLSDTVDALDANRVIEIVRSCLKDIGVDPETGEFDVDVIETGRSKTQRDRMKGLKGIIRNLQNEYEEGAPIDEVLSQAEAAGIEREKAEHEIQKLRDKGEIYSPNQDHLRVV